MVQLNLPALRSFLWGSKVNQALEDLNAAKTEAADVQAIAGTVAEAKFNEVVAAPNDAVVEALVQDSGSATSAALNSTFGPVSAPAARMAMLPGLLDNRRFNNALSQIQDNIVTVGDTQYAVWSNASRHPFVGKRTLPDGAWTTYNLTSGPAFLNAVTALDEHNGYSIAVDSDGFVHIAGNMHGDWLRYAVSTNPHDISAWTAGAMLGTTGAPDVDTERLISYPKFITHADGTLFFLYRNGGSGLADWYLNRYNTVTKTWTRVAKLLDGITDNDSAYVDHVVATGDGTIHISFQWRPNGGGSNDTNDLCYIRSADKGVTWTDVGGVATTVPVRHSTAPKVIDTAASGYGLNNSGGLGVDTAGVPHIVNTRYISGIRQLIHVWYNGSAWVQETITQWTADVTFIPRPAVVCAANGRTYVLARYNFDGWANKVWMIDVTPGGTRSRFAIADVALRDSELTFDARALRETNTLHMLLTPTNAVSPAVTPDYWGDDHWSTQWGAVYTMNLDLIAAFQNGNVNLPNVRPIASVAAPQPTSVSATTAALLTNMPLLNTVPELRGQVVMCRLTVQGLVTVDGTTLTLTIRELENGVGGSGRQWGTLTFTNTSSTANGGNQSTPWLPLMYGPRRGKSSQLSVFGVKAGAGVGTLFVCTLEYGVLEQPAP